MPVPKHIHDRGEEIFAEYSQKCTESGREVSPQARATFEHMMGDGSEMFSAGKDRTVFYSGDHTKCFHHDFADVASETSPMAQFTPIQGTDGGKWLDAQINEHGLEKSEQRMLWHAGSLAYANNAEGQVTALTFESKPESVFRQDELDIALNNEKVTEINGVQRETLLEGQHELEARGQSHEAASERLNDAMNRSGMNQDPSLDIEESRESWDQSRDMAVTAEENDRTAQQQTQSMDQGHGMDRGE